MTQRWARIIIDELIVSGVEHFFISPGSRSTPLVIAVVDSGVEYTVHFDERGSAFAALGYALGGRCAAWITTSGTALANGFPAIVEASISRLPLVLLTADRPPELRHTGSNQTIDQVKIFGTHVRAFVDVPAPTDQISDRDLAAMIGSTMKRSRLPEPGPVHINCMFRKPLEPAVSTRDGADTPADRDESPRPVPRQYPVPSLHATEQDLVSARSQIASSEKLLFIVGAIDSESARHIAELAEAIGAVILADIRCPLRLGNPFSPHVIPYYDLVLGTADSTLVSSVVSRPDVVVFFGERMTSRNCYDFVNSDATYRMRISSACDTVNPSRNLDVEILSDPILFCEDLEVESIDSLINESRTLYLDHWRSLSGVAENVIDAELIGSEYLAEPEIARALSRFIPDGSNLHLSCSMPVRDLDTFASPGSKDLVVTSNRGASGIDGTIATAYGVHKASRKALTLLIGDTALLHDLNSLSFVRACEETFVIVVVNNDGGGIFSFLPVSSHHRYFESCFAAPHGLSFEDAARMFQLDYERPETLVEFEKVYLEATSRKSATIIEVTTDRVENEKMHRRLREVVQLKMKTDAEL